MDFLLTLTLFGSVVWFWISILVFLIICFASDINENGYYAFGSLVVVSVVYYFYGDIKSILQFFTLTNILTYLVIGFTFASLKTLIISKKFKDKLKTYPIDRSGDKYVPYTQEEAKKDFIEKLEGNVTRWWFMWPVSLLNWLIKDLIRDIAHFIYLKFKGYFEFIVEQSLK